MPGFNFRGHMNFGSQFSMEGYYCKPGTARMAYTFCQLIWQTLNVAGVRLHYPSGREGGGVVGEGREHMRMGGKEMCVCALWWG